MAGLSFERVQIDGFRGLRGLDLDGLGRVNILIGANDSGKTSVLEALSVVCKPSDPKEWLTMVGRRDFGRLDETIIQSLRWCFTQMGGLAEPEELFSGRCEIECQGRFPLRRLAVTLAEGTGQRPARTKALPFVRARERLRQVRGLFPELDDQSAMRFVDLVHNVSWEGATQVSSSLENAPREAEPVELRIWENGVEPSGTIRSVRARVSLPCETLTPYSYQTNRSQVSSLSKQVIQGDSDQGLIMLQSFDPDVMAVQVLSLRGDRPAIYVEHRRLGWAPLSVFGDAMRRSILLAATLPRLKNGGMLLIDEVETGIHIKALGRVFQWLIESARQLDVQVFVTTHSLEALDAFILAPCARAGDVVAFRLSGTDGASKVKRFSGDLLLGLRQERGLDLR